MQDINSNIRDYKRKFYLSQIIKSLLWFLVIWTSYYLIISIMEYFLWMSPTTRTLLMTIMIGFSLLTLTVYIILPLLRSWGILPPLSDDEAAKEIGEKIPSISDKLLNYLQLKNLASENPDNSWYRKGALQKGRSVSTYRYADAINIKKNTNKVSRYLMAILGVLLLILMVYPAIITDSAERLWNPSQKFEPVAPFEFLLDQSSLRAIEGMPLDIQVTLKGKSIPSELDIVIDAKTFHMSKVDDNTFSYHIDRVEKPFDMTFESLPYHSKKYHIKPIQKVDLNSLRLYVDYPSYLNLKDHWEESIGDIQVPAGTQLNWSIQSPQIQNVFVLIGSRKLAFTRQPVGYLYSFVPSSDTTLRFTCDQKDISTTDTLSTSISVIQDQKPTLNITQKVDTIDPAFVVLTGEAADDHGLSSVNLVLHIKTANGVAIRTQTRSLPKLRKNFAEIRELLNFHQFKLPAGARVQYYVQATDNDVVYGGKTIRSQIFEYRTPTTSELQKIEKENTKQAMDALSKGQSSAQKTEKLIEEAKKDLLSKSDFSFQNKQSFNRLQKNNLDIRKNLEEFKDKMKKQQEYHKDLENEALKEKEKQLEELADDLMKDKIDKQMERIQKLMEKLEKKQATVQEMEQIQEQQTNIEDELQRLEELAKRLEMQVKMDELATKVDSAAVEELRLSMKIKDKPQNDTKLDQKRNEQDQVMKEIENEMQDLKKKNEDLESPFKLDPANQELQSAKSNMEHSDQKRQKNQDMQKSSEFSKDANKNLMNLAQKLQDMANDEDMDEMEEDIAAMRRLLQNLMKISFGQETLLKNTKTLKANSPKFPDLSKKQNEIKMQVQLIEDSLKKLANKDMAKGAKMKEELEALQSGLNQSLREFENFQQQAVIRTQQYNMMHVNNLTLYFGEGLNNMLSKSNGKKQNNKPGDGSCKNPGGKKPGPTSKPSQGLRDIITQQQKLGNQMKEMKNGKPGKQGQSGKPQKSKNGKPTPSEKAERQAEAERLARLAKEQEDLRKRIQELNADLKKKGINIPELTDIAKDQDKNEEEIINKRITSQLIQRQEDIITKMLKSEEAIREQEQGEKREAEKVSSSYTKQIPPSLIPYLKAEMSTKEKYRTLPPDMNEYYQSMIKKYFQTLQ